MLAKEDYEGAVAGFKEAFEAADPSSADRAAIKKEYENANREVRVVCFQSKPKLIIDAVPAAQTQQAERLL